MTRKGHIFMRSMLIVLSLFICSVPIASAAGACGVADVDFATYLERFKNDKAFQKTRIIYPLQVSSTEPDAQGNMTETKRSLSAQEIRDKGISIIRGEAEATALEQGEGKLCEIGPVVRGERATLIQYSCHTDVYGDKYEFVRKNGCWFLQHVAASGG